MNADDYGQAVTFPLAIPRRRHSNGCKFDLNMLPRMPSHPVARPCATTLQQRHQRRVP